MQILAESRYEAFDSVLGLARIILLTKQEGAMDFDSDYLLAKILSEEDS